MPSQLPRTPHGICGLCLTAQPLERRWAWLKLCERCYGEMQRPVAEPDSSSEQGAASRRARDAEPRPTIDRPLR